MENASKILMMGFSAILFVAALAVAVTMYHHNQSLMMEIEAANSFRVMVAGD